MFADKVNLKVMYEGKFCMERSSNYWQIKYTPYRVRTLKDVDPDCVYLIILKNTFEEENKGIKVRELWCVLPGSLMKWPLT